MPKINVKKEEGIALFALILMVVVIFIIITAVTVNFHDVNTTRKVSDLYNDLSILEDRISVYYKENKTLPVGKIFEDYSKFGDQRNPNDNDSYFRIDLSKLNNLTLTNGQGEDFFVINEQSHQIYYATGIESRGKTYYRKGQTETEVNIQTLVNKPVLSNFKEDVTYYVTWNTQMEENTTKINSSMPENWYDYSPKQKRWANIKTTGNGIDSYWVWIPRFAYQIDGNSYHNVGQGAVNIKFLQGTSNIPYGDDREINVSEMGGGLWVIHPAFTFGDTQLEGIWVAKYEASSTNSTASYGGGNTTALQVKAIPGVPSWRNITLSNAFEVCRNIESIGGTLGLSIAKENIDTTTSLDTTPNIDSHLMKNIEWGAVTYLSKSEYGKKERVWMNLYGENVTYTTRTGTAGKADTNTATTVDYNDYNKDTGIQASTTGNCYGVYDMNGGAAEFVAAYLENSIVTTNANGYYTKVLNANEKYKDKYFVGTTDTQTDNFNILWSRKKFGDALYETSSGIDGKYTWDNSTANFPNQNTPIFIRGGNYADGDGAGIFNYSYATGNANMQYGFRPVIITVQTEEANNQ